MNLCEADIERIRRMERLYDELRACMDCRMKDSLAMEKAQALEAYYTGGQWLADYERDERGEWPSDLKRGVLSQDGIDDLLDALEKRRPKSRM